MKFSNKVHMFVIYLFLANWGCEGKRDAIGSDNEIRVICSDIDKENIKRFLKKVFDDTLYTPEPEPLYTIKFSSPQTYSKLKKQTNLIIAAIDRDRSNSGLDLINKLLTDEQASSMVKGDPIVLAKDVHAYNQLFMVINAASLEDLMKFVDEKRNYIRKNFNNQFIERQSRYLFNENNFNNLEDSLKNEFGWSLDLPWGWSLIKKNTDSNFVWLGKEMPYQWIGIGWEQGNIVDNELSFGNFLWEWPIKNYKTVRFNDYKLKYTKADYNYTTAWRATGIWETIDLKESKGGPFRSYVFYDNKKDLTYHINYLIFYPGNSKSIFFRQGDMVLKTFKTH